MKTGLLIVSIALISCMTITTIAFTYTCGKINEKLDQLNPSVSRINNFINKLPLETLEYHLNNLMARCENTDCMDRFFYYLENNTRGYVQGWNPATQTPYQLKTIGSEQ